jgi:hypothetical protein
MSEGGDDSAEGTGRLVGVSASGGGRDDPDFDFALNFFVEAEFDGVHAEFLDRTFEAYVFGFDGVAGGFEGFADIASDDGPVEVVIFGGVCFDGGAVLADGVGDFLELFDAGHFEGGEFFLVFFDHPFVVFGGDGGFALWEEVVAGVAGFDTDDFAAVSEIIDIVDEENFDVAGVCWCGSSGHVTRSF